MFSKQDQIQGYDDALLAAMNAEEQRQEDHIELIASENYTSKRVMEAQGSGLTNKYAEGYPGNRRTPPQRQLDPTTIGHGHQHRQPQRSANLLTARCLPDFVPAAWPGMQGSVVRLG